MFAAKGKFETISYTELFERVFVYARALSTLGLTRGDRLCIFAENSVEWALSDWAAQTLGYVVVPIYPTLPTDQAAYIVQDSQAKAILIGTTELAQKLQSVEVRKEFLKTSDGQSNLASLAADSSLSRSDWEKAIDRADLEDVATIIYTSGTTGNPKGVVLPHRCFMSLLEGIKKSFPIGETDTFLSFLPLSHVYERFAGHVLPISSGATIAYAQSLATIASDMGKVKPTVVLCVPRFLEAMRNRILDSVAKQSSIRQKLFYFALDQGKKRSHERLAPLFPILDRLVGAKIRERTGGRLRFFVSGGAALSPAVSEFYLALGLPVLQGYGLTETMAASCVNKLEDNHPDTVGPPIDAVEVKIATDGEILIRGKSIMAGYFNMPEATAEAIDADGWFHTGDIGEFVGGCVKITDRKKDLLVLGNGKNIAPQLIENKLRAGHLISEAVLFGDGMEYVCALIVPNFEALRNVAKQSGLQASADAGLIELEPIRKAIKAEIDGVNKTLADFEKVKKYELIDANFSVETGELTPSMKVRRKVVKERFADVIKGMQRN